MRIVKLTAENVKRLKAVEITPDGDMVVISGRNAQGKSSVLDAIWMALAGADGAKETSRPIRDGEEKAGVTVDLGDLVVTRKWTKAGTSLEVANADGAKYSSPQTMLDGLIGKLTFDPLDFAQRDAKGQLATLLSVVDLPFVPAAVDAKRKAVFDERTEVGREGKRLTALVDAVPPVLAGTPDEETSASAIATELQAALAANQAYADAQRRYETANSAVNSAQAAVNAAVLRLKEAEAEAAQAASSAAALKEIDAEPIRARLDQVDTTNKAVRAKAEKATLAAALAKATAQWKSLTAELEAIDKAKADALAAAKMPLDGLSFDDDGVLYQGVPFSQTSSAEQLRVSVAMAMALNPKIRVIRITDGSLLDFDNLRLIEEMAGANDFQVWIERVDETGKVGVVIEDGEVKA